MPQLVLVVTATQDAGQDGVTTDEERLIAELVREITRRVVEELRNGDFLREQIRLGIEAYVRDQEAARAAASAEQARLANEADRAIFAICSPARSWARWRRHDFPSCAGGRSRYNRDTHGH